MPVYNTIVTTVQQRVVNTRDGRSATLYEIVDDEGRKWETWKQPIANEANRMIGRYVEITGRIEQNGKFNNCKIDDIRETNGASAAVHTPAIPFVEEAQRAQQQQAPPQQQRPVQSGWDEKDYCIMRQAAGKVSAWISNNDPVAFWENVDLLVKYFATGEKPQSYGSNALPPQPQENQFIPQAALDEPTQYYSNTDDDIPFMPSAMDSSI